MIKKMKKIYQKNLCNSLKAKNKIEYIIQIIIFYIKEIKSSLKYCNIFKQEILIIIFI